MTPGEESSAASDRPADVPATTGWSPGRIGLLLVAVALLIVAFSSTRIPSVTQPIAFNHRKHTVDLSLGCEFCHPYVTAGAHAGLPGNDNCAVCHIAQQGESSESARLTEMLSAGTPIRFNKLFRLPSYVYYTHFRHAGIAELACTNCHGDIADTERPPRRPLVRVDMKFCISCHRSSGQSTDCLACHR